MLADGALNPRARAAALERMASGLDLLIVGGGVTGAGAALDAAARGLDVGLVEARDLASGASSKSSKLIHGGLRYLEMGDIGLVREALRERELLLRRLAPHLVSPVPFLWPLRGRGWERVYLGTGLVLYDTLGGGRSVPRHRHLTRAGARREAPGLSAAGLTGAVQFHDAAEDDARMVAVLARTAAAHGALIATRTELVELLRSGERVTGAVVRDHEREETLTIPARSVALAVGAWTDAVRVRSGARFETEMRPSKGIHVVVPRERIRMETGLLARTEKSVLFVIPTDAGWLIGDTDTPWTHGPDEVVASGADVDYVLAKANEFLVEPLARADVIGVFAGLRPLVGPAAVSDTTRLSRRHVVERPLPGLTTIAGGKYTTYRVMAADLVDAAARELTDVPPSPTDRIPLLGADGFVSAWRRRLRLAAEAGLEPATVERLLRRYGDRAGELVGIIAERPELAEPLSGGGGHIAAEVVHACTHEGALRLEDVLERRTRLAITTRDRGTLAAAEAASLMAGELGWSPERADREVAAWERRIAAERAGEAERDDASALAAYRAALAGADELADPAASHTAPGDPHETEAAR
ncbi:MAG TPA: glycerol-3-phosphate dehydrogenase/oxidase [Solirubrobacteraceae bacterium]|nr:glycerol-3-phosphate dehydrogenase/oxidase [Solirubrobacteraceae bacterium]